MFRNMLIAVLAVTSAYAQQSSSTGTLTGFVNDPTGMTVVGAKATAVNTETKFTAEGETNETGRFSIPLLPPGSYELRVATAGFRTYVRTGIELRAGESPRIDVALELGSMTESVQVTGQAALLETETATAAASLPHETFMRIPILQSKVVLVLYYLPGVSGTNPLGQRSSALGNALDGVSNKEPVSGSATGTNTVNTTLDVLEEVRVMTTGIPAEYGRAGAGVMVAVMRSGTNSLHGSAEDRWVGSGWFQRDYFALLHDPTAYHQMSATNSGPVVLPKIYNGRNKTFFLWGWYRHHETDNQPATGSVPSSAMLGGDFSFNGLGYPIYDPASTRLEGTTWVRDPFPGNKVPLNRFDPAVNKFLSLGVWAAPNNPGDTVVQASGVTNNLIVNGWKHAFHTRVDIKLDHQISSSHRFFVRYNWNPDRSHNREGATSMVLLPYLVAGMADAPSDMYGAAFSDTLTISPTLINEFRVSVNMRTASRTPATEDQGWAQKLGIPNVGPQNFPAFANLGYNVAPGSSSKSSEQEYSLSESLIKSKGPHTLKMGWEVSRSNGNNRSAVMPSGSYTFGATDYPFKTNTGNAFAAFLLGSVTTATFTRNQATWLPRFWTHGLYIQDDFKPTRHLTINIGIRWGYQSPFSTKWGQQAQFDPAVKDPVSGLMGAITHPKGLMGNRDLNNFQPRLGVAWAFRPKFVFRGGFGLMTQDIGYGSNLAFDDYIATATVAQPSGDPRAAFSLSQGPPTIAFNVNPDGSVPFVGSNYSTRNATWQDTNTRAPYVMTWSGGIQYQFASTWLLETMYQGSSGVGMMNNWNINAIPLNISTDRTLLDKIYAATQNYKPYTQFGNINYYSNFGHSSFHSGTVRVEKRFSHGFTLNDFYTYSKALDNYDSEGAAAGITYYNQSLEKGVAGFDLRHHFVNVVNYDLPFGVGRRFMAQGGWRDKVFGGWKLTWTDSLQSGIPFSVSFAGSPNKYLPGSSRPNIITTNEEAVAKNWTMGPNRFPTSAQNPWLNAASFAYPAAYTAGSLGRNTFRGPHLYWPQSSLAKQWAIRERLKFTLRWDFNNVFKIANFPAPSSAYNVSALNTFARFTSVRGSISQLGGVSYCLLVGRLEF